MLTRSLRRTCRAAFSLALLLSLSLLLPALAAAQPPTPPIPETEPARPENYADPIAEVKAVELHRFAAMVQGDTQLVGRMLGEDLTYTHSSGAVDSKASFLAALSTGKLRYLALTPSAVEARIYANAAAVVTGRIEMRVAQDGKEAAFPARFTSVYFHRHGSWVLVAWQSTRLPQPAQP
jgi:Domain of unknown function (DUF4440)